MTRKRTYKTIINLVIAFALTFVFTGLENAGAGEGHYLNKGVRDTMGHGEKVGLIMKEDRSVTRWEAERIVARMDAVQKAETYGVRGNYRANLDLRDKMLLVMEENRELTPNQIPFVIADSTGTPEAQPSVGLGYHAPYTYGEVRANLSDQERAALLREERYK